MADCQCTYEVDKPAISNQLTSLKTASAAATDEIAALKETIEALQATVAKLKNAIAHPAVYVARPGMPCGGGITYPPIK